MNHTAIEQPVLVVENLDRPADTIHFTWRHQAIQEGGSAGVSAA
ncbi:hypothetical protein ACFVXG_00815 [Kitasatospora sp. NPDC058162]